MGTSLAATEGSYEQMHLDFHGWMLTGGDVIKDGTSHIYTEGTGGVKALIESLSSGALGMSPYGSVVVYDATADNEPLDLLGDSVIADLATVDSYDGDTDWATYYAAAVAAIEGELGSATIDAAVTAFTNKLQDQIDSQAAAMDLKYSNMNAVNSTARVMATALLEKGMNISAAEYRAQLEQELEKQKMLVAAQAANQIMVTDVNHFNMKGQFIHSMIQFTDMYITAKRQYVQDNLTLDVEDAYWDIKLYDFAGKALSSISGSSVIPGSPNPKLETLSGISSAIGAVSPLIIAAYKAMT